MRFFRRSRQRLRNTTVYQSGYNVDPVNGYPGQIRWNPFFQNRNRHNPMRIGINPFQNCVNNHVPKCLGRVSMSNILQGDRVENFSSECWLQDHLHQFGCNVGEPLTNLEEEIEEEVRSHTESFPSEEEDNDDSPTGSVSANSFNISFNSLESEGDAPPLIMEEIITGVSAYTMALEPPPYDIPSEPPPSYEEAVGANERRNSRGSRRSSDMAFLWWRCRKMWLALLELYSW